MALWLKGPERGRRVDAHTTKCTVYIEESSLDDCSAQVFPYNIFAYCSICRVDCKFARNKKKTANVIERDFLSACRERSETNSRHEFLQQDINKSDRLVEVDLVMTILKRMLGTLRLWVEMANLSAKMVRAAKKLTATQRWTYTLE
jgi:hypothetical protein